MVPFLATAFALTTSIVSPQRQQVLRNLSVRHALTRNMDEHGKCKFGTKEYWDAMYTGEADRAADSYSWYCGWDDLKPFWNMLVSGEGSVLIAGMGNDPTPFKMYDDGWTDLTAFDYSEAGVNRARELMGDRDMKLLCADARNLPLPDSSIDAVLDKGTLDAIGITGIDNFLDSVKELARVTAKGGVVVCLSRVIEAEEFYSAFDTEFWEMIHDGTLAFARDGEATIDLGAELYSWKRK